MPSGFPTTNTFSVSGNGVIVVTSKKHLASAVYYTNGVSGIL